MTISERVISYVHKWLLVPKYPIRLFKCNTQSLLALTDALLSTTLLLERLRPSVLHGLTHPNSWHYLCACGHVWGLLLGETQV